MKFEEECNTGEHNTYNETHQGEGSHYINNVGQVHYHCTPPSRMDADFRRLHDEIRNNTTRAIIDDLLEYETPPDGMLGLEQMLNDIGFTQKDIKWALSKEEQYARKAIKYGCYPSAQEINLLLFGEIRSKFDRYIFPRIKEGIAIDAALQCLEEFVVSPIVRKLNEYGEHDEDLRYTSDHIYGMAFRLTGLNFLCWKDNEKIV